VSAIARLQRRRRTRKVLVTVLAWALALIVCAPMYWMVVSSVKGPTEILSNPPSLWPRDPTISNYSVVFAGDFLVWMRNSVIVSTLTTVFVVVVGSLGGYSLVRFRYAGRRLLGVLLFGAYLLPSALLVVPIFLIVNRLGLLDTPFALVLANSTFAFPFAVWLLRSYFESISVQVESAARIDGASRLRAFVDVVIPQAMPGIISTAIFTFILAWNEYLFALVLISSSSRKTLPVGLASYASETYVQWGPLMAASVAVTVPVLVVFVFLQRRLVSGMGTGGIKG
jgi:multiple sugar transport system permease protein